MGKTRAYNNEVDRFDVDELHSDSKRLLPNE
jgi:hypothetical protein